MADEREPAFYKHSGFNALIRVHDFFTVENWVTKYKVWRKTDPGYAMDDISSPSWRRITAEEAKAHIAEFGGGPDDAFSPPSGEDRTYAGQQQG